jgi:CheY-like chemotaxis protein
MASKNVSILVATASSELARELRAQLEAEGYEVAVVDSGPDALAAAADPRDLILLDLELPGMDGLSVLTHLRSNEGGTTPVVLLKADDEPAHVIQRGFDFGASGYLNKIAVDGSVGQVVDLFRQPAPHENERRHVPRAAMAKGDACPYSSIGIFRNCAAFVPIEIAISNGKTSARTSCSHLRVGAADGWGLYPRCALGDAAAREQYLLDLSS